MLLKSLKSLVANVNSVVDEIIRRSLFPNNLAIASSLSALPAIGNKPHHSTLEELLKDSILWMPTPKKRTTAETKLTRKLNEFPNSSINRFAKPKTNIIACLECGSYHEIGRICGKCYEKVKEETDAVFKQMDNEEFKFNYPQKEVAVLYEDDNEEYKKEMKNDDKKRVVEFARKRPEWFNSNLMSKVNTK